MNLPWLTADLIDLLLRGLVVTVALTIVTSAGSMVVGLVVGSFRLSDKRMLRTAGVLYVEIFRNIPALVLIIFFAFAVPNLFAPALRKELFFANPLMHWFGDRIGIPLGYYAFAVTVALTLNTGAYIAELFRAGVGAIATEHLDAARTLGASPAHIYRMILVPQGVRAAFPAISTRLIHNMKNTALAAFVAVPELFHRTQTAITLSFRAVELLLLAALLYLLLASVMASALRAVEQRLEPRTRPDNRLPVGVGAWLNRSYFSWATPTAFSSVFPDSDRAGWS